MVVLGTVLFFYLAEIVVGDVNILLNPAKPCVPTTVHMGNCHICVCTIDGIFNCENIVCDLKKVTKTPAIAKPVAPVSKKLAPIIMLAAAEPAESAKKRPLPEIREGEPCFPGKLYKLDCNTCRCTKDKTLMCTKMGCFDWKNLSKKTNTKHALRSQEEQKGPKKLYLPKAQNGTECKPGKIYRSKCKRCYCTNDQNIVCSKKNKEACTFDKFGNPPPIMVPEDIHPPMMISDIHTLAPLPSASEQCEPGKSYRVDCNSCICMDSHNLLCQKKLCISYDDMNRIEAKELSGQPCQDEPAPKDCIRCKCEGGKTACSAITDCSVRLNQNKDKNHAEYIDPAIDKFKCVPHSIYKQDCNRCYCQEDSTLRCTQKTCLNYSQVKLLEEQRDYLEKHGL